MNLSTIPIDALFSAAHALRCWLGQLDPESERKHHRAAPKVAWKIRAIERHLFHKAAPSGEGVRP